ncbi:hypothetical protein LIT32_01320 [Bacillus sp. CMF21]|nr:hypothetical protein MGI18_02230 [Bacillus sp. OVS6]USK28847.1 hypothetical protein LIT32_01320 [Bacillus sp. CMF21]
MNKTTEGRLKQSGIKNCRKNQNKMRKQLFFKNTKLFYVLKRMMKRLNQTIAAE